jgi:hypothetical protein
VTKPLARENRYAELQDRRMTTWVVQQGQVQAKRGAEHEKRSWLPACLTRALIVLAHLSRFGIPEDGS